jgi:hypothetical protein
MLLCYDGSYSWSLQSCPQLLWVMQLMAAVMAHEGACSNKHRGVSDEVLYT